MIDNSRFEFRSYDIRNDRRHLFYFKKGLVIRLTLKNEHPVEKRSSCFMSVQQRLDELIEHIRRDFIQDLKFKSASIANFRTLESELLLFMNRTMVSRSFVVDEEILEPYIDVFVDMSVFLNSLPNWKEVWNYGRG